MTTNSLLIAASISSTRMTPHGIRPDWAVKPLRFLTAPSGVFQRGFAIPSFLLSPSGIMGAVIVALSISNFALYQFWQGAKDDFILYKAQVAAASAVADADNQRKIAEAERNTGEVARLYGNHIADLEHTFSSRLRRERDGHRETMSRTAEATAGVNGPATDDGLTASFSAACIRLELDCAVTTLTHVHLQDWVRKVCK